MRFHVSQKRIAIILLPIFDKLQFVVSICQKASHGTISCFWNFPKLQPPKHRQQQTVNSSCAYRDFISCNIIVDFWYCLAYCILYSTESKETSIKTVCERRISLKYRQRIFYSLLRAYCFPNNFDLNLVE